MNSLKTAVLFIVFNRPETTTKVFEKIRQAKPPRLYVASDGPREKHESDKENVKKTLEIATKVDWPCELKTLIRDINLAEIFLIKYNVKNKIIVNDLSRKKRSFNV
jgi:hypothetical protein